MKIINLTPEYENAYFVCLEEWSEEMKEAGDHKRRWFARMKAQGLRVKLALSDDGKLAGMIQYLPIKYSPAQGEGLYYIHCIWVHGYRQGQGDFQKKGIGTALLQAAEEDAREQGAKGMAAWGVTLPVFMRASWFKKKGYQVAEKQGMMALLWKAFADSAKPPQWIQPKKKPVYLPGTVSIIIFINGWCPAQSLVCERAKRAAADFKGQVEFREYDSSDPAVMMEWGISDGLYIDGREIRTGPPPSYKKIRKLIEKRVKHLR
jgi:GNAT superfamily N-acetyltransferase